MIIEDWTTTQRWLYAIKPASWPKLLVPMFLGQAIGIALAGSVSIAALAWGLAFTILDGIFIVMMNDWGDRDVDAIKRRMFPDGCSPKTIPDGILPAKHVLAAGLAAALGVALLGLLGERMLHDGLFGASLVSLLIFAAYTLPPLKLNYRGGGEILEMLGVGVVLPATHALALSGMVWSEVHMLLCGFAALSLASALASGLSDEESDREGGKTTFTTALGNGPVRSATELSIVMGILLWVVVALRFEAVPWWPVGLASLVVIVHGLKLSLSSSDAVTNAFAAQKIYKLHLHHAIWYGGLVLGTGILIQTLL